MPRLLNPAQCQEIAARYEAGERIQSLADSFGCSTTLIKTTLRDLGVKTGRQRAARRRSPHGTFEANP